MTIPDTPGIFEDTDEAPPKPKRGIPAPLGVEPHDGRVTGGVVLIALGIIFFLQEFLRIDLGNWWAIFPIIFGLIMLSRAITMRNRTGVVSQEIRKKFIGGGILVFVGTVFLLGLDIGKMWPFLLIFLGVAMLAGWIGSDDKDTHS